MPHNILNFYFRDDGIKIPYLVTSKSLLELIPELAETFGISQKKLKIRPFSSIRLDYHELSAPITEIIQKYGKDYVILKKDSPASISKSRGYSIIEEQKIKIQEAEENISKELQENLKKEQLEKERKQKEREEQEKEQNQKELDRLTSTPHLQDFIKKFIYTQLRDIEGSLTGVISTQIDTYIKDKLTAKFPLFINAMESLGFSFTSFQQQTLFNKIYLESEPIRKDLLNLLQRREHDEIIRREREEAEKKLREQRELTAAAFGEEITDIELVQQVENLKTLDEEIDDLLKVYESWDEFKAEKLNN